jgi:hypothetical protein
MTYYRDAMQIAARNGALPVLKLLHESGAQLSTRGKEGDTLVHLAAGNGHIAVLEWLASVGGLTAAGRAVDLRGQTAAHVAARRGEVEVLRYLHHVLDVDVLQPDFENQTPLEMVPKQLFLVPNAEKMLETRQFLLSLVDGVFS